MSATWAITKLQLKIVKSDPWFVIIMFAMPLAIMPLFIKTMGLSLNASGFTNATGAEQVVPGQAVLFGFFIAGNMGFSVFREHGWNTWVRLRASAASSAALMFGFAAPWILIHILYQVALITAGSLFTDLDLGLNHVADLAVIGAYAFAVVMVILFVTAALGSINQVSAVTNLGAMVMGGIGGALVPLDQLPGWAQTIAPVTPTYWAMQGHNAVFLKDEGFSGAAVPVAVLCAYGLVFAGLGIWKFKSEDVKKFFS